MPNSKFRIKETAATGFRRLAYLRAAGRFVFAANKDGPDDDLVDWRIHYHSS